MSEHYDLGILFVHGIGDQQQNSTLARFGGPLQRWLRRWYGVDRRVSPPDAAQIAPESMVEVTGVRRRTPDGDTPAHASLLVRRPGEPANGEPEVRQRWLLAEGWWAAEVSPPSFKAFARWVLPLLPWVAAEYAIAAARPPGPQPGEPDAAERRKKVDKGAGGEPEPTMRTRSRTRFERGLERLSLAGLLWLLSPVLALLAMLGCVVLALVQQVPVIGKRVNAITTNLVKGVGDAYLFAFDGLSRAAMVQRIRRNLDWLNNDERSCRRVAIVAHSQGAALCHDLLRSGALRRDDPVDLFVTVGSGVRRLNVFRQLHEDAKLRSLGWTSIAGLVALVTGLVLLLGGLGLPGAAGIGARAGGLAILTGCLVAQPARFSWRAALILAGLGAVTLLMTGVLVGGWPGARLMASAAAMSLGVGLYLWAAVQVAQRVIKQPPRLALPEEAVRRWVDFYSTTDPVPNGPMQTWPDTVKVQPVPPPAVHPTPRLVYNLRSVQADHSYYPDNTDEFVAELASELAAAGGLAAEPVTVADPVTARRLAAAAHKALVDPVQLLHARARRRWRTSCRSNARNLLLVSGLLGTVAITLRLGGPGWDGLGADAGVGTKAQPGNAFGQLSLWVQEWLAKLPLVGGLARELPLRYLAGLLLAAVVVTASALLLGRLWSVWDSNDIDRFFLDADRFSLPEGELGTWRRHWPSWAFLGLTGLLVLGIIAAVGAYSGRALLVLVVLAGALVFTAVLVWVRWKTCLDQTGPRRREGTEGGRQERGQGADELPDGRWGGRLEPDEPAGQDQAGDLRPDQRGAKVRVGDPEDAR